MKRSRINQAIKEACNYFEEHHWALPPEPRWDVTDFGLGDFEKYGLVLINLAEENEYCEKLMFGKKGQITPAHTHKFKKEDIIVRQGVLKVQVWLGRPDRSNQESFDVQVNGSMKHVESGTILTLSAGERVTLTPGIFHKFYPDSDECIIGEVSTKNDDLNDNVFADPEIGRYSKIIEDEPPIVKLLSD